MVREERQGAGSAVRIVAFDTEYHDDDYPRWSETWRYTTDNFGLVKDTRLAYTVSDGFGRPTQTWTEKIDLSGFVVVDTERDPRGAVRVVSEPHFVATFTNDYATTRAGATKSWAHYDALGDPVVSWDVVGGTTTAEWSEPGTRRTLDAVGYSKEEVHDTHGRLIEVRQGQPTDPDDPAQLTATARYAYDGLGRVREFVDGAGPHLRVRRRGAGPPGLASPHRITRRRGLRRLRVGRTRSGRAVPGGEHRRPDARPDRERGGSGAGIGRGTTLVERRGA